MLRTLSEEKITNIINGVKLELLKKRDNVEGVMVHQGYRIIDPDILILKVTAIIDGKKVEVVIDDICWNTDLIDDIVEKLLKQDRYINRRTKEEHIIRIASRMKETVIDYNRHNLKGKVKFYTIETEDFFDVYVTIDDEHFTIVRKFNKFNSEFLGKRFTPDEVDEYIDSDDAYYDVLEMLE